LGRSWEGNMSQHDGRARTRSMTSPPDGLTAAPTRVQHEGKFIPDIFFDL
jgi:hypothetical protein